VAGTLHCVADVEWSFWRVIGDGQTDFWRYRQLHFERVSDCTTTEDVVLVVTPLAAACR